MYSQQVQPAVFDFTPGFYNYGTLYLTLLKVGTDVGAAYGGGGLDPNRPDEAWPLIGRSHMVGRIVSSFAGAGMALLILLALRRITNDLGAACGAGLIALSPAHVVHSRFQTVDILAAFLLTASAYFALRLIPREVLSERLSPIRLAMLSGIFAGLSAGTKYTGILCLATLWVVAIGVGGPNRWKLVLVGTGAAIVAFLATTPGILIETKAFMDGFLYETKHVKEGHGLIFEGTTSGFLYHLANLFFGAGLLLGLLGIAGMLAGVAKKHLWAIALAAFFVPYFLVIAGAEVKFIRYTFPLYLGLAVGFGWLIGSARNKGGVWHGVVALGLLGLGGVFGGGLQSTAKFTAWMATPDPRDEAGTYLRRQKGSVGLVSDPWFYSPAIHPMLGRRLVYGPGMPFVGMAPYGEYMDRVTLSMTTPSVVRYVPSTPDGVREIAARLDWDQRLLTDSKPDFVVYSSFENEGLDRITRLEKPSPEGRAAVERAQSFMKRLNADYSLDRVFGPEMPMIHDMMYVQPTLWVWKRKVDR